MGFVCWLAGILMLLFLLYMYLIAPNVARRKHEFNELKKWDYAHRGFHDNEKGVPENSLLAFRAAVERGFGVELDVRLTHDNEMVVCHDPSLKRMCGVDVKIRDTDLSELKKYKLLGTDQTVPTFDEVLALIGGSVPMIVEIKTDFTEKALAAMVAGRLSRYEGPYCIESFDPRALSWYRRHQPRVTRGQLAGGRKAGQKYASFRLLLAGYMLFNHLSRPDFIAYAYQTDFNPSFRLIYHIFRPLEAAWTVREAKDFIPLKSERYDLVIFEGFDPRALNK